MPAVIQKKELIQSLQKEILSLQGICGPTGKPQVRTGLGIIEQAFPNHVFPTGAIHEFISPAAENAAATNGFIAGLLQSFMKSAGICLWISTRRTLYPPALRSFGLAPERIIFIDLKREKDALWAIEEALKCDKLTAVVGELSELGFTESRRLQLAVEQSRVTGFIHRYHPRQQNTTASVTRWKITPLPSFLEEDLPGVGHPQWKVQLQKVRNGKPGTWHLAWTPEGFRQIPLFTQAGSQKVITKTG